MIVRRHNHGVAKQFYALESFYSLWEFMEIIMGVHGHFYVLEFFKIYEFSGTSSHGLQALSCIRKFFNFYERPQTPIYGLLLLC